MGSSSGVKKAAASSVNTNVFNIPKYGGLGGLGGGLGSGIGSYGSGGLGGGLGGGIGGMRLRSREKMGSSGNNDEADFGGRHR